MLERLVLPLSYYLLLAAGLGACLYLFWTLKRDWSKVQKRGARERAALEETVRALQAELGEVKQRLHEAEDKAGLLAPPPPTRSGLNLSKRTQALRMLARGETPEHIAAALGLPEGEVHLLVKVQRLAAGQGQPS